MPPDQPYARDLAASAYAPQVVAGAASEPSSDEDENQDHQDELIVRQFGKGPTPAVTLPPPAPPSAPKPPPAITEEDGRFLRMSLTRFLKLFNFCVSGDTCMGKGLPCMSIDYLYKNHKPKDKS